MSAPDSSKTGVIISYMPEPLCNASDICVFISEELLLITQEFLLSLDLPFFFASNRSFQGWNRRALRWIGDFLLLLGAEQR